MPSLEQLKRTTQSEYVAPGVARRWLDGGLIVWFSIESVDRNVIDAWGRGAEEAIMNWPADRPFLTVQDFSNCDGLALTPYIRKKGEYLANLRPELPGRNAVILRRSVAAQAVKMFLMAMKDKRRERRLFFSTPDGIEWLRQYHQGGKA
ncbi:MAG: hypothetical protein HY862_16585 [Chloroflexi bacterium]|nr:hypothetical protein [Chloroflexota bacterium]